MKTMKKIIAGICVAIISAAMYYCFLNGAPQQSAARVTYMILTGVFCASAWAGIMGTIWYVKWLRKKKTELEDMVEILLKNTDKLDK